MAYQRPVKILWPYCSILSFWLFALKWKAVKNVLRIVNLVFQCCATILFSVKGLLPHGRPFNNVNWIFTSVEISWGFWEGERTIYRCRSGLRNGTIVTKYSKTERGIELPTITRVVVGICTNTLAIRTQSSTRESMEVSNVLKRSMRMCIVSLCLGLSNGYFSVSWLCLSLSIYMSHFSYACKMRCPLNLVLENCEYLWVYLTFWIVILDYGLKLHKLSIHTLVMLQKWLEIH